MSGYSQAVRTRLNSDSTLTAILTGGIYAYDATGRLGISRTSTPSAYDSDGFLRPCALIRHNSEMPAYGVVDYDNQVRSVESRIDILVYNDGAQLLSTLTGAADRIYILLHNKLITGAGRLRFSRQIEDARAPELSHTISIWMAFYATSIREG